ARLGASAVDRARHHAARRDRQLARRARRLQVDTGRTVRHTGALAVNGRTPQTAYCRLPSLGQLPGASFTRSTAMSGGWPFASPARGIGDDWAEAAIVLAPRPAIS